MGIWDTPRPDAADRPRTAGTARRHVLRLGLGATLAAAAPPALAGCDLIRGDEPAPLPPVDPLTPLHAEALRMAATYDRAALADPSLAGRLTPLAAAHRAHAAELARILRPTPPTVGAEPSAPAAAAGKATLSALRAAERQGQRAAAAACRQAPTERAALLGSIAAARASHVEALR